MSNTPTLSVILCTYNNADSLAVTLDQLVRCEVDSWSDIEILIIDNNSPDNTEEVVRTLSESTAVPIHYHFQQKQGLSNARNMGLEKARGDYLLFTDDDADIPTNSLPCYLQKIPSTQADCLFSKTEVNWDSPPHRLFDHRYSPSFVQPSYCKLPLEITAINHGLFSQNFCCKEAVLVEMGGFNRRIGDKGLSLSDDKKKIVGSFLTARAKKAAYLLGARAGNKLKPIKSISKIIKKILIVSENSTLAVVRYFSKNQLSDRRIHAIRIAIINEVRSIAKFSIPTIAQIKNVKYITFSLTLQVNISFRTIRLWIIVTWQLLLVYFRQKDSLLLRQIAFQ